MDGQVYKKDGLLKSKEKRDMILIGLIGLVVAVTAAVLEERFHPSGPTMRNLWPLYIKLMDAVGISMFIMGMLTLVLEMNHWKKYFEERLEGIVVGQDYLNDLSTEALTRHQIKVFRSYYKDENLSETGFIHYCLEKIHGYIVTPYREHVEDHLTVEVIGSSRLQIRDHLSYVCRKARGQIQERVAWQANSLEVLRLESLSLELLRPDESGEGYQRICLLGIKDLDRAEDGDGITYEYHLGDLRQVDRLKVIFESSYLAEPSVFNTWRMIDPSEKVNFSISYPRNLRMQFKPFLLEPQPTNTIDDPGYFRVAFDSWIMPRSGFAWKLLPAQPASRVGVPELLAEELPVPQAAVPVNRGPEEAAAPVS